MYSPNEKYHPLFEHLLYNGKGQVRMTFAQIEEVLRRKLPESARKRASWWSNHPTGHTQASSGWLRAGYRTSKVDLVNKSVTFTLQDWPEGYRKLSPDTFGMGEMEQAQLEGHPKTEDVESTSDKPHPAWGIWVGKVTLLPDYDYTQPADPDWGKVYDD